MSYIGENTCSSGDFEKKDRQTGKSWNGRGVRTRFGEVLYDEKNGNSLVARAEESYLNRGGKRWEKGVLGKLPSRVV